jgi:hypothetical protein
LIPSARAEQPTDPRNVAIYNAAQNRLTRRHGAKDK